jgi:hypothetical protein
MPQTPLLCWEKSPTTGAHLNELTLSNRTTLALPSDLTSATVSALGSIIVNGTLDVSAVSNLSVLDDKVTFAAGAKVTLPDEFFDTPTEDELRQAIEYVLEKALGQKDGNAVLDCLDEYLENKETTLTELWRGKNFGDALIKVLNKAEVDVDEVEAGDEELESLEDLAGYLLENAMIGALGESKIPVVLN